ncbi:MAG TPA: outer membrane lipoprotein carrier protein LolA [Flavobacteriaceae bacterium]|nr:outer membrane lipoprotein carrier protein LolA [Flavobacteriaceae bacterium]
MKKLFLIVTLLFISTSVLVAQDAQKAKKLLSEVSEKVKSYDNIQIEFRYTLKNLKENVNQESRGEVILQGEKYLVELMGATQMYDGKKLYVIVPSDEEVTISSVNPDDEDSITPSSMLRFYEKGYTYKWDIVQNVQGRSIQYVELKPTDPKSDIKDILLGIDSQTKHIYKLIQRQKNGTEVTITIQSFKTNQPLPTNQFVFDQNRYKGYYINKLD